MAAVLGTGVAISGAAGAGAPVSKPGKLTSGEKSFVKSVFGKEVNTNLVRKKYSGCLFTNTVMEVDPDTPNNIYICKEKYYSEDYSLEKDIYLYGSFIHEMTHIWQKHGTGAGVHCRMFYEYTLNDASRFSDFCDEQQAAIVEDYARRFLYQKREGSFDSQEATAANSPEADLLLQKVVEEKFPEARKTRLAKEKREKAPPVPNS